jgi:rod shape determining protein RodA
MPICPTPTSVGLLPKLQRLHGFMLLNVLTLLAFGLFAVENAVDGRLSRLGDVGLQQAWWAVTGLGVFLVVALVDYKWLRWAALPLYGLMLGAMLALKSWGVARNGAHSEFAFCGAALLPSQWGLIAAIAVLALVFGDFKRRAPVFQLPVVRLGIAVAMMALPIALIMKEPDLGAAALWAVVLLGMIIMAVPVRYTVVIALILACALPLWHFTSYKPYAKDRLDMYLEMLINEDFKPKDLQGAGWLPHHLQLAVGSAGWDGKGPFSEKVEDRASIHRVFFPDEANSDFIGAVIAEEFGFRGMLLLMLGLGALLFQCFYMGCAARDELGQLLVVGVVTALAGCVVAHLGMNCLLLPITGLRLPLVSYDGPFTIVVMFMLGLVQSVWVHRDPDAATLGADDNGLSSPRIADSVVPPLTHGRL